MSKAVDTVVLFHGYAENPTKVWFPWLHSQLEELGIRIWSPILPDPLTPNFQKWFKAVKAGAEKWSPSTVVIGHSIGGVLALRALELCAEKPIRAMITVGSPFTATVSVQAYIDFFDRPIDWDKLRRSAGKFVTIHSKNDPLVPYDHAYRYKEALGSKLVMTEKDGHFIGKSADAVVQELARFLPK
jgi:uncharacterized protein